MHRNAFNRLKTFQIIQKDNNLLKKEIKKEENEEIRNEANDEGKKDDNLKIRKEVTADINIKIGKRFNNNYIFSKGNNQGQMIKKRVSITNSSELNQNRFENITKSFIKKRTFNLNRWNH